MQAAVTGALGQASALPANPGTTSTAATAPNDSQSRPSPTTPLTITQALDLAEQNSPLLQEAGASVERAQASVQSARAYTNPIFEFIGGNQSARPIANPGVPGATLHYSASQLLRFQKNAKSEFRLRNLALSATSIVQLEFSSL